MKSCKKCKCKNRSGIGVEVTANEVIIKECFGYKQEVSANGVISFLKSKACV